MVFSGISSILGFDNRIQVSECMHFVMDGRFLAVRYSFGEMPKNRPKALVSDDGASYPTR